MNVISERIVYKLRRYRVNGVFVSAPEGSTVVFWNIFRDEFEGSMDIREKRDSKHYSPVMPLDCLLLGNCGVINFTWNMRYFKRTA